MFANVIFSLNEEAVCGNRHQQVKKCFSKETRRFGLDNSELDNSNFEEKESF